MAWILYMREAAKRPAGPKTPSDQWKPGKDSRVEVP